MKRRNRLRTLLFLLVGAAAVVVAPVALLSLQSLPPSPQALASVQQTAINTTMRDDDVMAASSVVHGSIPR